MSATKRRRALPPMDDTLSMNYERTNVSQQTVSDKNFTDEPTDETPAGSALRERLMRDAANVSEGDVRELGQTVPKKLAGFSLSGLDDKMGWIGSMIGRVRTLLELLRDPDYKLSAKSKTLIAAGLIYFVLPTDFTPDFIPGIGYLDDAIVLNIVWRTLADQIELYLTFRESRRADRGPDSDAVG